MRTISGNKKSREKNQNPHFVFSNFFPKSRGVYEIMHKNIAEPQMKIWRMRFACWITKATDINSEYVTRIAFPLQ